MVHNLAAPEFAHPLPPSPNLVHGKIILAPRYTVESFTLCDSLPPWPPHDPHRLHHSVSTRAPGHFIRPNPLRALLAHPGALNDGIDPFVWSLERISFRDLLPVSGFAT